MISARDISRSLGGHTPFYGGGVMSRGGIPAFGSTCLILSGGDFASAENPYSQSGSWGLYDNVGTCQATGGQLAGNLSTTNCTAYYDDYYGPDCDAYFTIATKPAVNADKVEIMLIQQGQANVTSQFSAYGFAMAPAAGTDDWVLGRWSNGTLTTLDSGTREWTNGEKLGIRKVWDNIQGWVYTGGVWTLLASATDNTFGGMSVQPWQVGLRGRGTTFRVDDFYAGTIRRGVYGD